MSVYNKLPRIGDQDLSNPRNFNINYCEGVLWKKKKALLFFSLDK